MKRQKRRELFSRQGLTWQKLVRLCTESRDRAGLQAAGQDLKNLLTAARQIGESFIFLILLLPITPQPL